jgi:hypothetical protein
VHFPRLAPFAAHSRDGSPPAEKEIARPSGVASARTIGCHRSRLEPGTTAKARA